MNRLKFIPMLFFVVVLFSGATLNSQEETKAVGGGEMLSSRTIVENAVSSKDHTTLVEAIKAADLVETLSSKGPFTVFAPTNEAFNKLPEGTVSNLLDASNKETLQDVLKYHVVVGKFSAVDLIKLVEANDGEAQLTTVSGDELTISFKDNAVFIADASGNIAKVTIADVKQSNGIIHVIDTVVLPN